MKKRKQTDELLEVAQEITFAKALASNDKTLRDRALRRLKKWLESKSKTSKGFTEGGFVRLWRGLFYNVWMSDKPLIQEEVIESVCSLVHCFNDPSDVINFILSFFQTLSDAWQGLDFHRLDKYLMFVRRFLRQSFMFASKSEWKNEIVLELSSAFKKSLEKASLGLFLHVCEIYLEELAKVSNGRLKDDLLLEFIKPFGEIMSNSSDGRLINHIGEFIYIYLLKQSDLGIKHEIKFNEWKRLGCPEGNINVMQEVEIQSEEEDDDVEFEKGNTNLDARAGNVHVLLPPLKFNATNISNHLMELKRKSSTTTKGRKRIADLVTKYKTYVRGKYPLGIHKVDVIDYDDEDELVENAAYELMEEELEMFNKEKEENNKNMKKEIKKKGKWEITPLKSTVNSKENGETYTNTNWQVTNITSTDPSETKKELQKVINNKRKRGKKNKSKSLTDNKQLQKNKDCSDIVIGKNNLNNSQKRKRSVNGSSEPESVSKLKRNREDSNSPVKEVDRAKECHTPGSGKKVEFVLSRNSFQDEKEYRRSLKEKPFLKFDGDIQPQLGVLKSTPFSSRINPFVS